MLNKYLLAWKELNGSLVVKSHGGPWAFLSVWKGVCKYTETARVPQRHSGGVAVSFAVSAETALQDGRERAMAK